MKFIIQNITAIILLCISSLVSADDTEILGSPTNANILFVMDLSASMGWGKEPESIPSLGDPARIETLRNAFQSIVTNPNFDKMNFGLSVFSGDAQSNLGASVAHGITYPVSPLLDGAQATLSKPGIFTHPGTAPDNSYMPLAGTNTTSQYLSLLSADTTIWSVGGSTPIVDALFEAARYFRGDEVFWGRFPPKDIRSAHPSAYAGNPLTELITTVTPACTAESRKTCTRGSCGPTEDNCKVNNYEQWSATDTGGCTLNPTWTQNCAVATSTSAAETCGSGNNCTLQDEVQDRVCSSSYTTIDACKDANPNYHSCESEELTRTVVNGEGQSSQEPYVKITCKENVTFYRCDQNPSYSCPRTIEICDKCPDDTTVTTVEGSAIYKSPIVDRCTNNGIIFLTDGEPTQNTSADFISTMIGPSYANNCQAATGSGIDLHGRCGPELAKFLATEDQIDGTTSAPNIVGNQTVVTHTIGLALDETSPTGIYLQKIATNSGGSFFPAENEEQLTLAFEKLVTDIAGKSRSFAAPSYSVDTSTLLSHGNSVYVPMFDKKGVAWPGNLKKFQLVDGELKDINGDPATDSEGGILSTAKDMWSDPLVASTDAVTSGGAANKIDPAARLSSKMITNVGGSLVSLSNGDFGTGTTAAEKQELLDFISGKNTDGTKRNHMGDIMHSKPIQLEISTGSGATLSKQKIIFVGSNEGFLHAIKDSDGTEAFAFMPHELIKNISPQYENTIQANHIYGVDSPITLWIDDSNNTGVTRGNGVLDVDDNEQAYLFFGLRRGGKGYYALNVTNPDIPTLAWSKEISAGDSWSQPVVKMLKQNATDSAKPVLILGGGYSDTDDGSETLNQANAVYLVDAKGGPDVWSKTISTPEAYSIPAKIRVLDVDRNGSIDRLYFGDTGGNIWRVDLDAGKTENPPAPFDLNKAEINKLASLGGTGSIKRKFFEEPSVAVFKDHGKAVITIAIGSGDRPNPLSEDVEDKFFVLYDKDVFSPPPTSTTAIVLGDLKASTQSFSTNADSFKGWYKDLTSSIGEKVLSTATIYQNKILFTTFGKTLPDPNATSNSCLEYNEARFYILDLKTAAEYLNTKASTGEILGTPQLIFPDINSTNCVEGNCKRAPVKACAGYCGPARPAEIVDGIGGSPIYKPLGRVYWIDR